MSENKVVSLSAFRIKTIDCGSTTEAVVVDPAVHIPLPSDVEFVKLCRWLHDNGFTNPAGDEFQFKDGGDDE